MINSLIKRLMDITVSAAAIIILLPIWIIIPLCIKMDSKGPVLFKQGRRTKDGRIFNMYKYRSMVVNAEKIGAGLFNYKDDPRVTSVGRKLRDSSLDELPQLFNILLGDMSLVGPRPCVTYELGDFDTLNRKYRKRFAVKAGLTGLAQVKGRNDISWEEKVTYDNLYIDNFKKYGVIYDLWIILCTFGKVFQKQNIYEHKADEQLEDSEAAAREEAEIIRLAHIPDDKDEQWRDRK